MKLYKLESSDWASFFGEPKRLGDSHSDTIESHITNCTIIAQTPSCDAFLLLTNETYSDLELQNSVPSGFDFTYCQAWGLETNQTKIDRVIEELS